MGKTAQKATKSYKKGAKQAQMPSNVQNAHPAADRHKKSPHSPKGTGPYWQM
jgi:hypothetical protein